MSLKLVYTHASNLSSSGAFAVTIRNVSWRFFYHCCLCIAPPSLPPERLCRNATPATDDVSNKPKHVTKAGVRKPIEADYCRSPSLYIMLHNSTCVEIRRQQLTTACLLSRASADELPAALTYSEVPMFDLQVPDRQSSATDWGR